MTVQTSWQYQHSIIEAAQERGWEVIRVDVREGVVLTEPVAGGIVMRLSGPNVTSAFIRSLPEARQPEERPA